MDDFLYKYRFLVGGILIFVILAGSGVLLWQKFYKDGTDKENSEITELQKQNEKLRSQLSDSSKEIAGAETPESENQADKININTADSSSFDKNFASLFCGFDSPVSIFSSTFRS